jgi:hypothetical protein
LIKPRVDTPAFRAVANKLVELAVVEKKLVLVALVEVEKFEVRERIVEEEVRSTPIVEVGARYVLPAEPRTFQSRLFNQ